MEILEVCELPAVSIELPVREKDQTVSRHFIDPHLARDLIGDLLQPSPIIYWADFAACLSIAATAVAVAFVAPYFSLIWAVACLVASAALYRLVIFSHELAHLRPNAVPGFKLAWNLLVGVPLLMPSVFYVGMHDDHHRTRSYGTDRDPEYRPFAGARLEILLFTLHSVLIYPILAIRLFVLAPAGLLLPPFHRWLERKASSVTMNPRYERRMTAEQRLELCVMEVAILLLWGALIGTLIHLQAEWKFLIVFMAIMQPVAIVNSLRTLAAHRYHSDGSSRGKNQQVLDSVDIPGGIHSALWAPVGLRYHALHHYFPTIPYHNLGAAYRRLVAAIPENNDYRRTHSAGLWFALRGLWTAKRGSLSPESTE